MTFHSEFVQLPPAVFGGLETRFITVVSKDTNNLEVIPALWQRFIPRLGELTAVEPGICYGLCDVPDLKKVPTIRPNEALYLAGIQLQSDQTLPPGMVSWRTPGGLHARFLHHGPISGIGQTMGAIYGIWLPESGYARSAGPDLERYDSRFHPTRADSVVELYIPVRRSADAPAIGRQRTQIRSGTEEFPRV